MLQVTEGQDPRAELVHPRVKQVKLEKEDGRPGDIEDEGLETTSEDCVSIIKITTIILLQCFCVCCVSRLIHF